MNHLLEKIIEIFKEEKRGKVLDLGCGDGDYSYRLKELGFSVLAADLDKQRFRYKNKIEFQQCDLTKSLPFEDCSFDYVLLLEVIEHLKNPYFVIGEINRVLKPKGTLVISTPNILNLKSRLRFLFEGNWEFFREPPLEQMNNPKEKVFNLHIIPWRYQELEYLLFKKGFKIKGIFTSILEINILVLLLPLMIFHLWLKRKRVIRKGGIDYSRIHKILLSKELLYGRHLILKAVRKQLK
ncbi:MAG: hypothetical protein B5M48_01180 [Candidatus Omnitrophica bacterium 4484_213]|nr:MAG: hypothetical protein B5M48_01180 [Candidatus Omnitrophica bacterium 4484_213]